MMPLNIKNPEADRLARELADATGETLTRTVIVSLRERLERVRGRRYGEGLREDVARIQERLAGLPRRDRRSDDEIVGYDEHGLPADR